MFPNAAKAKTPVPGVLGEVTLNEMVKDCPGVIPPEPVVLLNLILPGDGDESYVAVYGAGEAAAPPSTMEVMGVHPAGRVMVADCISTVLVLLFVIVTVYD